jgi:acyl dehydratase
VAGTGDHVAVRCTSARVITASDVADFRSLLGGERPDIRPEDAFEHGGADRVTVDLFLLALGLASSARACYGDATLGCLRNVTFERSVAVGDAVSAEIVVEPTEGRSHGRHFVSTSCRVVDERRHTLVRVLADMAVRPAARPVPAMMDGEWECVDNLPV